MLTKEDKIVIKNIWESKKYGVRQLIKEFLNKNGARVMWRTFWSDCEQRGLLNEHRVVDVRALLRTLTLWGTWYGARRINLRHTTPLDRSHKSSKYLKYQSCVSYTTTYRLISVCMVLTGPVCCEPRHRRVEASSVGLCRRWWRTFWTLLMTARLLSK